jgi:hypothetical protein
MEVDDTEQYTHVYEVKIGDRFAALENSDDSGDISRAWGKSYEKCEISGRVWKQH